MNLFLYVCLNYYALMSIKNKTKLEMINLILNICFCQLNTLNFCANEEKKEFTFFLFKHRYHAW